MPTAGLSSGPRVGYDLARVGAGLSRGPNKRRKLTAAAWSGTWPAPGATLDLDFSANRGFVRGLGQGGAMDAVTFTRASSGTYLDSAGVLQTAASGAYRLDWASTATVAQRNLLTYTEALDNAAWTAQTLTVTPNATTAPDGANTAEKLVSAASTAVMLARPTALTAASGQYTLSCYFKSAGFDYAGLSVYSGGVYPASASFNLATGVIDATFSGSASIQSVGSGWYRCSVSGVAASSLSATFTAIRIYNSSPSAIGIYNTCAGNGVDGIYAWGAQLETGSSATAYQAIGSAIPTQTPLAASATCNGLLIEESRQNRILWCRDATQSNWTKTNVTPLKDQTGIDGVANSASSLTASADGGTCIQTITLASGSRTNSVYLKRLVGTGNVQVSLDGSTWSTVDLSNGIYNRIVISGTVTNPTVGIKLATNGDAVAMDYAQVEDANNSLNGWMATSPILTTNASATRSADVQTISGWIAVGCVSPANGTVFSDFVCGLNSSGVASPIRVDYASNVGAYSIDQGTSNVRLTVNGVSVSALTTSPLTSSKVAASFSQGNGAVSANGGSVATGSFVARKDVLLVRLGDGFSWGYLRRVWYSPAQTRNNGLQELTR